MAITLNIATELCVFEVYPKLCEYITKNFVSKWLDSNLVEYLTEQGYDVSYNNELVNFWTSRFITFNDDKQYLDFVLRYS